MVTLIVPVIPAYAFVPLMIVAGSVTTKVKEQVVVFSVVGCVLLLFSAASTCCVLKKIVPFFMTKSRYPVFCFFDGLPCDVAGMETPWSPICLLYTSDAADEEDSVDLGGRRIIKK